MPTMMNAKMFIDQADRCRLIDVRSPSEFTRGHVPGAVSLPLFDDDERAQVGTVYKRHGHDAAVALGLQIVTPRTQHLVERARGIVQGADVLVHCWRGGMRSGGVARLLENNGFRPRVLEGGYKAYRNEIHRCFTEPRKLLILSGLSGVGKTQLLSALRDRGEQVVDLEQLACHRGSAFGGIGQPPQPTVEQFENDLFRVWRSLDPTKPIWIEDEGRAIGRVFVPPAIWQQMRDAPVLFLEVSFEQRADFLVQQYGGLPAELLSQALEKISKRLGGECLSRAQKALAKNNLCTVAEIALQYYDKSYYHACAVRPKESITRVPLAKPADTDVIPRLLVFGKDVLRPVTGTSGTEIRNPK
jgi:tRNA 2-selenouridine synthase